jgi:hypothetical protein
VLPPDRALDKMQSALLQQQVPLAGRPIARGSLPSSRRFCAAPVMPQQPVMVVDMDLLPSTSQPCRQRIVAYSSKLGDVSLFGTGTSDLLGGSVAVEDTKKGSKVEDVPLESEVRAVQRITATYDDVCVLALASAVDFAGRGPVKLR